MTPAQTVHAIQYAEGLDLSSAVIGINMPKVLQGSSIPTSHPRDQLIKCERSNEETAAMLAPHLVEPSIVRNGQIPLRNKPASRIDDHSSRTHKAE